MGVPPGARPPEALTDSPVEWAVEMPRERSLLPPEFAAQRASFPSSCARRSDDTDALLIMPDWFGYRAPVEPDEICGVPAEAEVERELSR